MEKSIGLEKARLIGLTREVKNLKLRIEKLETTLPRGGDAVAISSMMSYDLDCSTGS